MGCDGNIGSLGTYSAVVPIRTAKPRRSFTAHYCTDNDSDARTRALARMKFTVMPSRWTNLYWRWILIKRDRQFVVNERFPNWRMWLELIKSADKFGEMFDSHRDWRQVLSNYVRTLLQWMIGYFHALCLPCLGAELADSMYGRVLAKYTALRVYTTYMCPQQNDRRIKAIIKIHDSAFSWHSC